MHMKYFIPTMIAATAEILLRVELPQTVQDALWGLAILAIGLIGIWVKGTITRINVKHDLELDAIRANQEASKGERVWLLETTKTQVNQIGELQKANEQLQEQNRQRDMEIGAQREATARITKERDELKERAEARHDAINKAQAETAEAIARALKETNRADAAEGDLAGVRRELETIRVDLAEANERIEGLQAQLDAQALAHTPPTSAEPAAGSTPTTPAGGTVA
jgi:DNA repair exonuclease SbcCD ATPase subunit